MAEHFIVRTSAIFDSEHSKLAKIGTCFVLGSVEDERCFSSLKFLKSSLRNSLGKNLPMVVCMHG
jgi:hypothetical protein